MSLQPPRPPAGQSSLWRNGDFLKLWSAQTVSITGSLLGALQLTAILALAATPLQLSLLTAAGVLPALLCGFVVGAWVDRLRRRPVLIAADLLRAALLGSIPGAWFAGALRIEQLYLIAFLHGLLTIFFDVAYRSYLPSLVRREQLVAANSRLSASASVAEVGAFSLGGWIAQLSSAIIVAAVDAVTFLVSALLLTSIRTSEPAPAPSTAQASLRREIVAGLRLALGNPILRAIGASRAIGMGLGGGIIGTLVVLYGIETLGFAPGVLGTIFAIGGATSILGALSASKLTHRFGLGKTLAIGFLLYGLSSFLIPLARGPLLLAGALLAAQQLADFALAVYEINEVSLRQGITAQRMLGRVNASLEVVELGSRLAGSLLAGVLAEAVGLRWALAAGAGLMAGGGLWLVLSPVRRVMSVPPAETAPTA